MLASHLLGANRAVSNFGGGNTSAKGTTIDHTGREINAMWVKGSGSDLATMGPEHFTGLKLDEILPLLDRDEMSDEDMVAYLAQSQLDPKMPRASIETLLHAFVPAPHVHHTHPDGINVLAGTADGERLIAECFGDEAAWIPYIRPGFTLSKQVGLAVRENPDLKLVVLAKHGLIVWGETRRGGVPQDDRGHQPGGRVRQRARRATSSRFGGRKIEPAGSLTELLPAIRGAVSSERAKVLTVDTSERVMEFVCSEQAERLVKVGAPCPDHLVHTKRLPLWVSRENATPEKIAELAEQYRADYRAYFESFAGEGDVPGDPDPRVVLVEGMGLVSTGTTTKLVEGLARPLPPRDRGHRGRRGARRVRVAGRGRVVRDRVLAAGALQARAGAQARRAAGQGRARDRRRGRHRPRDHRHAGVAPARAWSPSTSTPTAPPKRWRSTATAAWPCAGDVTSEEAVAGAFRAAVEAVRRRRHRRLQRRHRLQLLDRGDHAGRVEPQPRDPLAPATSSSRARRSRCSRRRTRAGRSCSSRPRTRSWPARTPRRTPPPRPPSSTSRGAWPRRAAATGIRVNTVNPDAVLQGSKIWGSSWREERAAAYNLDPEQLDEHYRQRNTLKVSIYPGDIAEAVLHFASERRSGKSTGNILNVDGGVPAAYSR